MDVVGRAPTCVAQVHGDQDYSGIGGGHLFLPVTAAGFGQVDPIDLFEAASKLDREAAAPLAARMRPQRLEDLVGQASVVGPDTFLRRAIESDRLPSLILYGPPGSGKTTLARIISSMTRAHFVPIDATASGVAEIRRVIEAALKRQSRTGERTIAFIDEIHRFNKAQQDALLPAVENGTLTLIGATTENPYFTVNGPLLSRARIVRLDRLDDEAIRQLLSRALADESRGLGSHGVKIEEPAMDHIVRTAGGDARAALGALEAAVETVKASGNGLVRVADAEQATGRAVLAYDRNGDNHYDTVSAWIKSMRGSDPDAAVYWLARMLQAGEDPRFLVRRLLILAAEDVGNADPQGLQVAAAAAQAVEWVGMPEARIPLAQATTYLAAAPKSNAAYVAIDEAMRDVATRAQPPVPAHLRDASYRGAAALGHGVGYRYPHDDPHGFVEQSYRPEGETRHYYRPKNIGDEARIKARLDSLWPR